MQCIKTGCHVKVGGEYVYGDAFKMDGYLVVRACQKSFSPIMDRLHFEADTWANWFDAKKTSHSQNSTLIVKYGDWRQLGGYEGVAIDVAK